MFNKFIEIPIYRGNFGLIISKNRNEITKIIPEFDEDDIFAHTYYHDKDGIGTFSIVLNFNNDFKAISLGVIAHECYHVVSILLQSRGVDADFHNDEPGAYLIEWVYDKIIEWIKESKFNPV